MTYYQAKYNSPQGEMTIVSDGKDIKGIWFDGQKYFLGSLKETPVTEDRPELKKAIQWMDDYYAGKKPNPNKLPLAPIGSDFRQSVWKILLEIPYGEVITYGDIAKKLSVDGKSMSAQAVGGAVGHNPISVVIPCHRVVGSDGSLTGYAGGIQRKVELLQHEKTDMSNLYVPTKGTAI